MSNLLYMDESNGNGVYAVKQNQQQQHSNLSGMMSTAAAGAGGSGVAAVATTMTTAGGALSNALPTSVSVSNEDLSQSLSEYTDADESVSAPTEFLAEFLSAVMLKDYKKALEYCKLILQYEPNNATAREFHPLILAKLRASSDSDENYNKSSSPELALELAGSELDRSTGADSDEIAAIVGLGLGLELPPALAAVDYNPDDFGVPEDNSSGEPQSHESNASLSLSESVESDNDEDDEDDDDDDDDEEGASSSGDDDDLPIDEQPGLAPNALHDMSQNHSGSSSNSSNGGGSRRSGSDNTTHSYSSLLLEEEDDIVVPLCQLQLPRDCVAPAHGGDMDVSNGSAFEFENKVCGAKFDSLIDYLSLSNSILGNKAASASCSDSESPTEPLTQRLAAILRSKCGVPCSDPNY